MKILLLVFLLSLNVFAVSNSGGGHDGNVCNGGGGESEEFVTLGSVISQIISSGKIEINIPNFNASKFADTVKIATIIASDEPQLLNGEEKDALNYPAEQKIVFNVKKFNERTPPEKSKLVTHEYLWLAGVNDENYKYSEVIIKKIEDFLSYAFFKLTLKTDLINFAQVNLKTLTPDFKHALETLTTVRNSDNLKKCSIQATSLENYINTQMIFCGAVAGGLKESIIDLAIASPDTVKYKDFLESKTFLLNKYIKNESGNKQRLDIANEYIEKTAKIVVKYPQKSIKDAIDLENSYRTKCPGRIATSARCTLNVAILFVTQEEPVVLENFTSELVTEINDLTNEIDSL